MIIQLTFNYSQFTLNNTDSIQKHFYDVSHNINLWSCHQITPTLIIDISKYNQEYSTLILDTQFNAWTLKDPLLTVINFFFLKIGCEYNSLCDFISLNSKFNIDNIPFVYGQSIYIKLLEAQEVMAWINLSDCQKIITDNGHSIDFIFTHDNNILTIRLDQKSERYQTDIQLQLAKQISLKFEKCMLQQLKDFNFISNSIDSIFKQSLLNNILVSQVNRLSLTVNDLRDFHILNSTANYLLHQKDDQTRRISRYLVKYHLDIDSIMKGRKLYLNRKYHTLLH